MGEFGIKNDSCNKNHGESKLKKKSRENFVKAKA
jgi:hypothetical protein